MRVWILEGSNTTQTCLFTKYWSVLFNGSAFSMTTWEIMNICRTGNEIYPFKHVDIVLCTAIPPILDVCWIISTILSFQKNKKTQSTTPHNIHTLMAVTFQRIGSSILPVWAVITFSVLQHTHEGVRAPNNLSEALMRYILIRMHFILTLQLNN